VSPDESRFLTYIETYGRQRGVAARLRWGTLLSSLAHALLLAILVVIHLLLPPEELPKVPVITVALITPASSPAAPPPPPPPPLRAPRSSPAPSEPESGDDARERTPTPVLPESSEQELSHGELASEGETRAGDGAAGGVEGGQPEGVEGGAPGGVEGGVVGGLPGSVEPSPALAPVRIPPDSQAAVPIVKVIADYPEYAVRSRVEGMVILDVLVSAVGEPDELRVLESHVLLESAAVEAVKKWRWSPYLLKGEAVPFKVVVTIHFRLTTRR